MVLISNVYLLWSKYGEDPRRGRLGDHLGEGRLYRTGLKRLGGGDRLKSNNRHSMIGTNKDKNINEFLSHSVK